MRLPPDSMRCLVDAAGWPGRCNGCLRIAAGRLARRGGAAGRRRQPGGMPCSTGRALRSSMPISPAVREGRLPTHTHRPVHPAHRLDRCHITQPTGEPHSHPLPTARNPTWRQGVQLRAVFRLGPRQLRRQPLQLLLLAPQLALRAASTTAGEGRGGCARRTMLPLQLATAGHDTPPHPDTRASSPSSASALPAPAPLCTTPTCSSSSWKSLAAASTRAAARACEQGWKRLEEKR